MAVLSDEDVIKRVESPMNLINRLRSTTKKENLIVSIPVPPKANDIISNLDEKVTLGSSKTRALSVMNRVLGRLDDETTIANIKVERLPAIVAQMATAIKGLEPEKDKEDNRVQFVIYSPTIMKESDYGDFIEVKE